MHATATKENTTSHSRPQSSQPFFSKKGEDGFFSPEKETKPFFSPALIQPKLTINEPGDQYEQEADAMADRLMRMSAPPTSEGEDEDLVQTRPLNITAIQRKCAKCEAEEKLQRQEMEEEETPLQATPLMRKSAEGGGYTASPQLTSQLNSSKGGGSPLPGQTLGFMNQAFGSDFSNVRIRDDSQAAAMSQGIQAKAFTHGSDIYFNRGQYSPESSEGKRLLGHELTHVVQQGGNYHATTTPIQRNVGKSSTCTPNDHSAPANAIEKLTRIDALAKNMSLGCSHLLLNESMLFSKPEFGPPSNVFDAYQEWFDLPSQNRAGKFKSRLNRKTFATQNEAIAHDMQELSNRFLRIHNWLSGSIRYFCPGTAIVKTGICRGSCKNATAMTCPGTRQIDICRAFWDRNFSDEVLGTIIIHEAAHALLKFWGHPMDAAKRGKNPGCYEGFINQVYNTGHFPGQCGPVSTGGIPIFDSGEIHIKGRL